MKIISTGHGFILKFDSIESMETHINNLKGQLEWVKQEDIQPPYLYSVYYPKTTNEEMQNLLDKIKEDIND